MSNGADNMPQEADGRDSSERKKEITGEEYLLIAIVLLTKLRAALTDPNTPNHITISEWMEIVTASGSKAWEQYQN